MFGTIDIIITILYMIAVASVGIIIGKGQKTTRDYFLGKNEVPWWAVGLSIIATETSAATFIGIPVIAFGVIKIVDGALVVPGGNMTFIQIIIGYVIARLILAAVMVPHYFKGEIYSPYQILAKKFGESPCSFAAFLFLCGGSIGAGVRVFIVAIMISVILNVNIIAAIAIFVIIAVVYTYIGGIKAVIWADVMQFTLLFGGGIFAVFYIAGQIDGGFGTAFKVAGDAGIFQWFNSGFGGSFGEFIHNLFYGSYNIWMGVIGATFMVMNSHGADQLLVQRLLSCKSVKEARKAYMASAILIFPLFFTFLMVGAMLFVYYKARDWGFEQMPPVKPNDPNALMQDYVFPIYILHNIPVVFKGLMISAVFAAATSSVDSALSALSSVSIMDFYKKFIRKGASEEHYLKSSRIVVIFWGIILIGFASLCIGQTQVVEWALALGGLTAGATLGSLLFAVFTKYTNPKPIIAGMALSFITMFIIIFFPKLAAFKDADWIKHIKIAWPWFTLLGTIITMGVAWIGSQFAPYRNDREAGEHDM